LVAAAAAVGVLSLVVRAELPPFAYADPKEAPEILVVEAAEVTATESGTDERAVYYHVKVVGRVREAVKSGAGFGKGDTVVIHYTGWKARPPRPGQRLVVGGSGEFPVLEKGEVYRVHLEPDKFSHERKKDPYFTPRGAPYNAMVRVASPKK
jgi:hypothetical protein